LHDFFHKLFQILNALFYDVMSQNRPIKAMNDQYITLAHEIEHILKFWALNVLTGLLVDKDLFNLQSLKFF